MVDFVKLAATAERLIEANGRTVTLVKQGSVPADVDKPWRGQNSTVAESVAGKAVFVSTEPGSLGAQYLNPDNTKRGDEVAFFAANNDNNKALETYDTITDGSSSWKIVRAQVLKPADIKLIYIFEVAR